MTESAAADTHDRTGDPSPWVLRFAGTVRGNRVLDLACGDGRHGRLFLGRGCTVTFLDRDTQGVADLVGRDGVEIVAADLEGGEWPLDGRSFDVVVVTNYLWRPILPRIVGLVAPGGILIYETFARGNEALGRPRNPDFLLCPGELVEAVRGRLLILAYGQARVDAPRPAVIQHIAAVRPPGA